MALFRDDSSRTEAATPRRLDEAADKGQVALSRELVMAAGIAGAVAAVALAGPWLFARLRDAVLHGLDVRPAAHRIDDTASLPSVVAEIREMLSPMFAPALALAVPVAVAGLAATVLQVGVRFRGKALRVDFGRMSPAKNFGRLFGAQALIRALLSMVLFAASGAALWAVARGELATFTTLIERDLDAGFADVFEIALTMLTAIVATLAVAGVGDLAFQRFDHHRQLRMTRQEVEDERKRTEGDPLVRSRLRQAAQSLARQRMMEAVPDADVVITNPTHFAVALAYERGRHAAPEVVAKGSDEVAFRIRTIAEEHGVPVVEDPPLARALHRRSKVGQEIPAEFFRAVATVLGHVLSKRGDVR